MILKDTLYCLTHPVQALSYILCWLYLVCIVMNWQTIQRYTES